MKDNNNEFNNQDDSVEQDLLQSERRKTLQGIVSGAAMIKWATPSLTIVALPAHGQTSDDTSDAPTADDPPPDDPAPADPPSPVAGSFFGAEIVGGSIALEEQPEGAPIVVRALNALVPSAHAGVAPAVAPNLFFVSAVSTNTANTQFNVRLLADTQQFTEFAVAQIVYEGTISTESGGTLMVVEDPCAIASDPIEVQVASASETTMVLNLPAFNSSLTIMAGSGTVPSAQCIQQDFVVRNTPPVTSVSHNKSLFDLIVPVANAGVSIGGDDRADALAIGSGTGFYDVTLQLDGFARWSGNLQLGGPEGLLPATENCSSNPAFQQGPIGAQISIEGGQLRLDTSMGGSDITEPFTLFLNPETQPIIDTLFCDT